MIIDAPKAQPPPKVIITQQCGSTLRTQQRLATSMADYLAAERRCDPSDAGFRQLRMTPTSAN